jgi:hypothetical protein
MSKSNGHRFIVHYVPTEKRCTHLTKAGRTCRAARRNGSEFCIYHDEAYQQQLRQERKARKLSPPAGPAAALRSAQSIHELLERTAEDVRRGLIPISVANSIGFLAQCMLANLDRLKKEMDSEDFTGQRLMGMCSRILRTAATQMIQEKMLEARVPAMTKQVADKVAEAAKHFRMNSAPAAPSDAAANSDHAR